MSVIGVGSPLVVGPVTARSISGEALGAPIRGEVAEANHTRKCLCDTQRHVFDVAAACRQRSALYIQAMPTFRGGRSCKYQLLLWRVE